MFLPGNPRLPSRPNTNAAINLNHRTAIADRTLPPLLLKMALAKLLVTVGRPEITQTMFSRFPNGHG